MELNPGGYSDAERAEAERLYVDEDLSERAVAERMQITRTRVRALLSQSDVLKRPVGRPAEQS